MFAEDDDDEEIEDEDEQEETEPTEEDEVEDEEENPQESDAEDEDNPDEEENQKKAKDKQKTPEDEAKKRNRENAQRRILERQQKQEEVKRKNLETEKRKAYIEGVKKSANGMNKFTNQPIVDDDDVEEYELMLELEAKGKDPINDYYQAVKEKNRAQRQKQLQEMENEARQKQNVDDDIDAFIQKYGANNFWFEILEKQVENYNEREKYWIQYYNSLSPNGYNLMSGGEDPPIFYSIEHPNAAVKSKNEIIEIKNELRNTSLSLSEIAKNHNISKRTVLRINQGLHYEELGETYPIRETPNMNGKLSDDQIAEIIEILRFTYRQYKDIAKQYNVKLSTIKQINAGICHPLDGVIYPIRTYKNSGEPACTYEQVTEISELLLYTKISCRQIAKSCNVNLNIVYMINNGTSKRYCRKEYKYPLRKHSTGRRPCIDYPC